MASWVIHTIVAGEVLKMLPELDVRGFVVGNIAPDCNVENADWTEFTPSREVTHRMTGKSKLSADYEGFYEEYMRPCMNGEQYAFYMGYYSHLITDVEFMRFSRAEGHVAACFERAKRDPGLRSQLKGLPENFDTLKMLLGRSTMEMELRALEAGYLRDNPGSLYDAVLRQVNEFPDYLEYMPEGAVARKIRGMQGEHCDAVVPELFVFFTRSELEGFVQDTARTVYEKIMNHMNNKL